MPKDGECRETFIHRHGCIVGIGVGRNLKIKASKIDNVSGILTPLNKSFNNLLLASNQKRHFKAFFPFFAMLDHSGAKTNENGFFQVLGGLFEFFKFRKVRFAAQRSIK